MGETKVTGILSKGLESLNSEIAIEGMQKLARLVRAPDLVGDLIKMDYSECDVLVHDHARQLVRGLPLGCFLLATRMSLAALPDPQDEDASILLLRVTGQTRLPNASEADLSRFLAGQRVATLDVSASFYTPSSLKCCQAWRFPLNIGGHLDGQRHS